MRAEIEKRVSELETEFAEGKRMLAELEARQTDVQQTLLRISGALQVLNELLAAEDARETDGAEPAPPAAADQPADV
ncbi:hypothetical protein [Streptomyces sp. 11x1]|uniref:hypothetical protein n=1 Tax=Streptomyces sp. 11x1 TaxID=3038642 RepID=UPI00292E6755|nr:hypothetical protein [Streptomyces sp. 11x1]WNZ08057.1 hypothetical protein P8T65_10980 [Streptomyces sp. 11x1]